jgi:hypothetical protein
MKKILVSVSFILLVSVCMINAQAAPQDGKKTSTEIKANCAKCPHTKGCSMMAGEKGSGTGMSTAKCKELGCDSTKCTGKCDQAKCKKMSEGTTIRKNDCDPAKCKMMSKR